MVKFNFDFLKNNKKEQVPDPSVLESVAPTEEEVKEEKPRLTLEEEFALLDEKKKQIEALMKERQDFYLNAKELEEKIKSVGITDEKIKEIRETIMQGGGEISEQITNIRKEYGIEPTPVEIYSARLDMLMKEIERVKNNMAPEYREVKKIIVDFFGDTSNGLREKTIILNRPTSFTYFVQNLDKHSELEEVRSFMEETRNLSHYNNPEEVIKAVDNLQEKVEQKIKENTKYKTEGEEKEAFTRIDKLLYLADKVHKDMREAEKKEGRFASDKGRYF